jgi:peptidyl-prolyl cis-trans isomerase D
MFDYVRSHQKLIQIVLGIITVPFAFWGIDSYVRGASTSNTVAKVGSQVISQGEFEQALNAQMSRLQGMLGKNFDREKFDTPESRQTLINSLVERRLVVGEAARGNLTVSTGALQDAILGIDAFQDNGKFSSLRYEAIARQQGVSKAGLDELIRSDLTVRQLTDTIDGTEIPSKTVIARWQALNEQEREVSQAVFSPVQFLAQAQVTPEQVKKYYDENGKTFEAPQEVSAEYVVLSLDKLSADIQVSEDEVSAYYQANQKQYAVPEQREASHILIAAGKAAPAADRAKARARAEELLAEVRKNPASFAELAKKNSQDPGSAAKGGDLGVFSRGMMVKPFDDTVFSMKEGEISPVVETDFGYHVIKLNKIRAAGVKPLAEARADIEHALRTQKAQKKFDDAAEAFSNLVYEQADSLKPAADKFGLPIQRTAMFAKRDAVTAAPALNNEKLLNALFSDDAIKAKHNTEAVETAPHTLVSARVVQSTPARVRTMVEMAAAIEQILSTKEAGKLALKKAEATLAELQKGGNPDVKWSPSKVVSRANPLDLKPDSISAIFRVDAAKLPGYAMAELPESAQVLYRVSAVRSPLLADTDKRKQRELQLGQTMTRENFDTYVAALKAKTKIDVNQQILLRKEP